MAACALRLRREEELLSVARIPIRVSADGTAAGHGERDQDGDER